LISFEGMEFTGDLTRLVADQLATGRYRGREDSAPGDWLARAWHALPADERPRLTAAIHAALTHADPQVRVEAVRLLDGNPRMADPERLLDLVEQHWDLFKGLRSPLDPPGVDRGSDLVRLVADRASGSRGTHFRKNMSRDPVYGIHVLAALADEEPEWAAEHIHELVTPALDPHGMRLKVLVYNLRRRPAVLRKAVTVLAARQPACKARLTETIRAQVGAAALQAELLRLLE